MWTTRSFFLLSQILVFIVITSASHVHHHEFHKTCRFFIWDGVSAIKYMLCRKLIQENLYEGKGGKKFIRMKPGGLLEYLYPLSRHKLDRCLLCGNSFRDHLICWWDPFRRTPWDQYLDRIRETSEEIKEDRHYYRYHDAYVHMMPKYNKEPRIMKQGRQKNKSIAQKELTIPWDERRLLNDDGVKYKIPRVNMNSLKVWKQSLLLVARAIILEELDMLVFLEERCT